MRKIKFSNLKLFSFQFNVKKTAKYILYFYLFILSILYAFINLKGFYNRYKSEHSGIDFTAYYTGALILKYEPNKLYNLETQKIYQHKIVTSEFTGVLSFRNTPLVAFLYQPFTFLEYKQAYLTSYFLQIFITTIFIILIIVFSKTGIQLISLGFAFLPATYQPIYGQITIFIAYILLSIFMFLKKKNYIALGIICALLILKIQYLVVIPFIFFLVENKKIFIKWFLGSSILLIFIDSFLYRGFYLINYIKYLISSENYNAGTNVNNFINIFNFFIHIGVHTKEAYLLNIIIYLICLYIFYKVRKNISLEILYAVIIIWCLSLTVHALMVDLIFLLIPIYILLAQTNVKIKVFGILIFLSQFLGFEKTDPFLGAILLIIGVAILLTSTKEAGRNSPLL